MKCLPFLPAARLLAAVAALGSASAALAGLSFERTLLNRGVADTVARASDYDVVVATVEKVSGLPAVNARPPVAVLKAHEVLRGDPRLDRREAVWAPLPFDEYCAGDYRPLLKKWEAQPLDGPKVGQKMILLGKFDKAAKGARFRVLAPVRFPYSEENRRQALRGIRQAEEQARRQVQEEQARKKAFEAAMKAWRARYGAKDIQKLAAQADFVGVGVVSSGPGIHGNDPLHDYTFAVREIWKGKTQRQYTDGKYHLGVRVTKETSALLYPRDREFLLFLSEKGLRHDPSLTVYPFAGPGDTLVEADAEAVRVARAALRKGGKKEGK
jgi:hypothetical protein